MSKFNGIDRIGISKKGKNYATILIDGVKHLVFDPYVSVVKDLGVGSEIEFQANPNNDPTGPALIRNLRVVNRVGGNAGAVSGTQSESPAVSGTHNQPAGGRGTGSARRDTPDVQLSIFMGYSKDLVASGHVVTDKTPEGNAKAVLIQAKAFMKAYNAELHPDATGEVPADPF